MPAQHAPGSHSPAPYTPSPYPPGPSALNPYAPAAPGPDAVRTPYFPPPRPGKGMALGALWTGVGALVLGFLSAGVLGIVGGIVGIVLGGVTLRRVNRGTASGSETAIFGMALSAISIVLGGLLFFSAWPALVEGFREGWEQGWEQGGQP